MVTTWIVFETTTGHVLKEFTPVSGGWSTRLNEAETVTCDIMLDDAEAAYQSWRLLATPWKHSIGVCQDGVWFGGPILPHDYEAGGLLKLTARGVRTVFAHRVVLPPAAATRPLVDWEGNPDKSLNTRLEGVDLGTIARFLVWQAMQWPGGSLPIDLEPPRPGSRKREYVAVEMKIVDDALKQLSEVQNGPDIMFDLYQVDDSHMRWRMRTGTEQSPRLTGKDVHVWDVAGAASGVASLAVKTDPSRMGSNSWAVAGRGDDTVLVAKKFDDTLVAAGFPLLDIVDTSHTNVSEQSTLDGYAAANAATGQTWGEFWEFDARLDQQPFLDQYRVGDDALIIVGDDSYLPAGEYRRRILAISGDIDGQLAKIVTGEARAHG